MLAAEQFVFRLVDLRRQVSGAAPVRVELLHQPSVGIDDFLFACTIDQTQYLQRLFAR